MNLLYVKEKFINHYHVVRVPEPIHKENGSDFSKSHCLIVLTFEILFIPLIVNRAGLIYPQHFALIVHNYFETHHTQVRTRIFRDALLQ